VYKYINTNDVCSYLFLTVYQYLDACHVGESFGIFYAHISKQSMRRLSSVCCGIADDLGLIVKQNTFCHYLHLLFRSGA